MIVPLFLFLFRHRVASPLPVSGKLVPDAQGSPKADITRIIVSSQQDGLAIAGIGLGLFSFDRPVITLPQGQVRYRLAFGDAGRAPPRTGITDEHFEQA